jgi:hypothetical protein
VSSGVSFGSIVSSGGDIIFGAIVSSGGDIIFGAIVSSGGGDRRGFGVSFGSIACSVTRRILMKTWVTHPQ